MVDGENLLQELEQDRGKLDRVLSPSNTGEKIAKVIETEPSFRFGMN